MINQAPNSQWEVFSGVTYSRRWNVQGTGPLGVVSLLANSTGNNQVQLSLSGDISQWKPGDLIKISGAAAHPALTAFPMRILAISGSRVTVRSPLGAIPTTSGTGSVEPVNIGGTASSWTGDAADGWKKSTNVICWREDNAANVRVGARYALGLNKHTDRAEDEYLGLDLEPWRFAGRSVCFGAYVYHKVRGGRATARAFVNAGGTGGAVFAGPPIPSTPGWHWVEFAHAVPADASHLTVGLLLDGPAGDTYYVCNPVLALGTAIGEGNYVKSPETLFPVVHISPLINVDLTFPTAGTGELYAHPFDLYALTGGAIARSVVRAEGCNEAINPHPLVSSGPHRRLIGFADAASGPIKLGPFLGHVGEGAKSYGPADIPLKDGAAVIFSGFPGDRWVNISVDLDKFYLV